MNVVANNRNKNNTTDEEGTGLKRREVASCNQAVLVGSTVMVASYRRPSVLTVEGAEEIKARVALFLVVT